MTFRAQHGRQMVAFAHLLCRITFLTPGWTNSHPKDNDPCRHSSHSHREYFIQELPSRAAIAARPSQHPIRIPRYVTARSDPRGWKCRCISLTLFSAGMWPYSLLVCRLAYLIAPRQRKGFQKTVARSRREVLRLNYLRCHRASRRP